VRFSTRHHPLLYPHRTRHEFYETDERLILTVFDRGADPAHINVDFQPRRIIYENGEKILDIQPLKGQIDPEKSSFVVGKVKVEIRLVKVAQGRWGGLIGDAPDPLANSSASASTTATKAGTTLPQARKNWDSVTKTILDSEKPKTSTEDPNVSGDSTLNEFFQNLFSTADDDTKRAMMKSFQESGGTALSTNWEDVKKAPVAVKAPAGSEARKWEQ